jgi:hypothetical protein
MRHDDKQPLVGGLVGSADDTEWLVTSTGWIQYEYLERLAICAESGVPGRTAVELACQQLRIGAHSRYAGP